MEIPLAYQAGYEKAHKLNSDLAAEYTEQTTKDDPAADAVIEALAPYGHEQKHELIKAAMEQDKKALAQAPKLLREFFDDIEPTPAWFDSSSVLPGCVAFHGYSDLFIPAFVVATVQNASTLIAKAFYRTGRVLSGFGPRRIRRNTRHFVETGHQRDFCLKATRIRPICRQVAREPIGIFA